MKGMPKNKSRFSLALRQIIEYKSAIIYARNLIAVLEITVGHFPTNFAKFPVHFQWDSNQ